MIQDVKVPEIGENVESGKIVAVSVKAGDRVKLEDTIVEIETDKAVVEIPSPYEGTVSEVLVEEGQAVRIGDVIARVDTQASEAEAAPQGAAEAEPAEARKEEPVETAPREAPKAEAPSTPRDDRTGTASSAPPKKVAEPEPEEAPPPANIPASPSIRRKAREWGVDLEGITGNGPGGRITEADLQAYVKQRLRAPGPVSGTPPEERPLPDFTRWGAVETMELTTIRRITAQSTAGTWRTVPHVTQFDEADVTELKRFMETHSEAVSRAGGKLTLTPVLTKICAAALVKFPIFNASIDVPNNRLILKKYVHIAIAVATPQGLLMPVVRDADRKSITELAVEIGDLARRARDRKIKPDEMEGGTFSISNQGGIGGTNFTPIIHWPQAAILGMSRSAVRQRYIEGRFVPRSILPLSLSYDHRIVDGADAAAFLDWVCSGVADPLSLMLT